jgi:outer membrane protein OmpA-like peptidoglycan-associated protein
VIVVEAEPPEGHIFFLPNSDSFDDMTDPRLTRLFERNLLLLFNIASYMNAYPQYTLRITGYANPVDKTEAEETESLIPLSGRRAAYVKDRLIELGVDEGRLFSTGLGGRGTDPAASENNRRVEFSFEK